MHCNSHGWGLGGNVKWRHCTIWVCTLQNVSDLCTSWTYYRPGCGTEMCGKLYLQLKRMQWTQPELLCRAAIVVMQPLLELHSPAWTYSTWAHYSCASKGPCQKGATKEVNRRAFIFIIIRGGDVVHKSWEIFFCWIFFPFLAIGGAII